jgi:hypothetical protein
VGWKSGIPGLSQKHPEFCLVKEDGSRRRAYRDLLSCMLFADQVTVPRLDLCVPVQNPPKAPKVH